MLFITSHTMLSAVAQQQVYVVDMDFSGLERSTVVLFELPQQPGEYVIDAADIPNGIFRDNALANLTRVSIPDCENCLPLNTLGTFSLNEKTASGTLLVHPSLLPESTFPQASQAPAYQPQARPGLVLNWGLRAAERDLTGDTTTRSAADIEVITSLGGPVLRHNVAWLENSGWLRGSTAMEYFAVAQRMQLILGDEITAFGPLSSAKRFAGISLRRRFDTQPGSIYTPAYDLSTVSQLPGVAELYIDGERKRRSKVDAGTVRFEDISGQNGSNVTLRFTDELGVTQEVTTQLLGTVQMLGKNQVDFDFTAGVLREDQNTYRNGVAAGSVRYGALNWLNIEGFFESVEQQYNAALGLVIATPLATIEASASRNFYPDNVDSPITLEEGEAYTWSISNQQAARNASIVFGYSGRIVDNYRRLHAEEAVTEFQRLFAGTRFGETSISASVSRVDDSHSGSLRFTRQWGRIGLSAGATVFEEKDELIFASVSWSPQVDTPLRNIQYGQATHTDTSTRNIQANFYSAEQRATASMRYQEADVVDDTQRVINDSEVRVDKRWRTVAAGYQHNTSEGFVSHNLSIRGGAAVIPGGIKAIPTLSRNDGYLEIHTGLPGVDVVHGRDTLTTDDHGRAVVTSRGFVPNRFSIDLDSLPDGYTISHDPANTVVVPGGRAIVETIISAPGFLLTIKGARPGEKIHWNGRPYPVFQLGSYIENGTSGTNKLMWKGQSFDVSLPEIGSDIPEFEFDPKSRSLNKNH